MIQPGDPIDLPAFLRTLEAPSEIQAGFEWADPRIIATGPGWVCWRRPAAVTSVFIRGKGRRAWVPDLIMVAGSVIRVWACGKSNGKDTKLYNVGWSNTYTDGRVCWGNGMVPTTLAPTLWEDAFFASSFDNNTNLKTTIPYAPSKLKAFPQNLGQALASLSRSSD